MHVDFCLARVLIMDNNPLELMRPPTAAISRRNQTILNTLWYNTRLRQDIASSVPQVVREWARISTKVHVAPLQNHPWQPLSPTEPRRAVAQIQRTKRSRRVSSLSHQSKKETSLSLAFILLLLINTALAATPI